MRTLATGKKGFTLIEIIVVMAIISILASMTIPRLYAGSRSSRLRGSARRLLVAAQYARNFATSHRAKCRLMIDRNNQQYVLAYQKNPQHNPYEFVTLGTSLGKTQSLSKGISFARLRIQPRRNPNQPAEQVDYVTFDPTGQADAAVLEITDGKNTYSLLIVPYTGYAKLIKGTTDALPNDRIDLDA